MLWVVTTITFLGSWTQFQHVDGDVWCFPIPVTSKTLGHQLGGVLQFNSIPRLRVAPDSTGEGLSPTRLPLHWFQKPTTKKITNPGFYLCFWPTGYRLEIPKFPFLCSINLLELFLESRESFYLLDHLFTIKGYNLGAARWRRCRGQGVGKGCRAIHALPRGATPLCSKFHVSTNVEALWNLSPWVCMEASLQRHVMKIDSTSAHGVGLKVLTL